MEPHIAIDLQPYQTVAAMWNYLKRTYHQENSAHRFPVEFENKKYSQGLKGTNLVRTITQLL